MKKQKSFFQKSILSAVFMLAILGGFGFGISKAEAGICICADETTIVNDVGNTADTIINRKPATKRNADTGTACYESCKSEGYEIGEYEGINYTREAGVIQQRTETASDITATADDICSISEWFSSNFLKCVLLAILAFVGALVQAAAALFELVIDPKDVAVVISQPAIYQTWTLVRDTLNVSFILVLLFTAFGIVFQVDKFSNKKIIITVILMALLVNFSFSISRFIIDFSNVIMTYFLNSLSFGESGGSATGFFGQLANQTTLNSILKPNNLSGANYSYLISAVVFSFIFAITLLVIAVLLLVRIVVLTLLVIFSPLAFVGTIVPFFSKQAGQWWDNLFKYSFFGPVMVFMLYVSMKMLGAMQQFSGTLYKSAQNNSSDPGNIASIAFFIIPIVILWIGLSFAQSISIFGAGTVTGQGKKFINWAARGLYRAPVWAAKQTGVPGGMKQRYTNWQKSGWLGSDKRGEREAKWAGEKERNALERKKLKELRDKWKDAGGATDSQINDALNSKNSHDRKAAAMELAEKKGFADLAQYQKSLAAVSGDPLYQNIFNDKVKEKNIKYVIEDEIHKGKSPDRAYEDNLGKMTNDDLAKQKGLHENIDTDVNLQNHIRSMQGRRPEQHQKFFEKLTPIQQEAYIRAGLNP